jgi:hypothetical protein
MPSNGLENSARPKLALSLPKGPSECIRGAGVPANMVPVPRGIPVILTGTGMLGEMPVPPRIPCETGTGIPPSHPALPKLNANRHTNLLAIALTRWKQRLTTLSNRHKIHFANGPFLQPTPGLIRL